MILIIEDDKILCNNIKRIFELENMDVIAVNTGEDGLYNIVTHKADIVILDRMLPDISGIDIIKQIRKKGINTPVLMLTARASQEDIITGLDAGADDYLTKPFKIGELKARVRVLIRRINAKDTQSEIKFGDITLCVHSGILKCKNEESKLPKKASALLFLLLNSPDNTLKRDIIFNKIWGAECDVNESILDTYISLLRKHIKSINSTVKINVVKGVGFYLSKK